MNEEVANHNPNFIERNYKAMKFSILIFGLFFLFQIGVKAVDDFPVRSIQYKMKVELMPAQKMLKGEMWLEWTNQSADTLNELQFHLYMNAFKNENSSFFKNSDYFLRKKGDGRIVLKKIIIDNQKEKSWNTAYIQPDDKNKDDETVIRLPLDAPLLPGKKIQVYILFDTYLPKIVSRAGYAGDFFMVGQWFPKIGVYQKKNPTKTGMWNCHQYHTNSEFFADFADYQVEITLPQNFVVGASGYLQSEKIQGKKKTLSYVAPSVIDFAFGASPDFKKIVKDFNGIQIELLYPLSHKFQTDRYLRTLEFAIAYMNSALGRYPYKKITVIDVPFKGMAAGAMEYPMLFTNQTIALAPSGYRFPESVIAHEFVHQYFMGILASNEAEEPWLDEGFTSYYETRIMDALYGQNKSFVDFPFFHYSSTDAYRVGYTENESIQLANNSFTSWEMPLESYFPISYDKTVCWLKTLEKWLGIALIDSVFKVYYEHFKFGHPTGIEFITLFNDIAGTKSSLAEASSFNWFFNQVVYSAVVCDYSIQKIEKDRIIVERKGEMMLPVEIYIKFENGKDTLELWDGKERQKILDFKDKKVKFAKIDPQDKIFLDINPNNNSKEIRPEKFGIRKIFSGFLFAMQNILECFAIFA